jgi:hypothetical protein
MGPVRKATVSTCDCDGSLASVPGKYADGMVERAVKGRCLIQNFCAGAIQVTHARQH